MFYSVTASKYIKSVLISTSSMYEITGSQLRGISSPKTGYGHFGAKVKGSCEPLVIDSGSTGWKA